MLASYCSDLYSNCEHNHATALSTIVTMASKEIGPLLSERVLLLLGLSGSGKSMVGNIIAGQQVFPIRSDSLMTQQTKQYIFMSERNLAYFRVIDTVGLDERQLSEDAFLRELTTAVLIASDDGGIHVFLICVDVNSISSDSDLSMLDDLEAMKNFWPHAMILFTNAGRCSRAKTDKERDQAFNDLLPTLYFPHMLQSLKDKVEDRIVFLDYNYLFTKDDSFQKNCEIMKWVTVIVERQGVYNNSMTEEAKLLWEDYKLKVQENEKQVPDIRQPSYKELAKEIVTVQLPLQSCIYISPFLQILHGIEETRRVHFTAPPGEGQAL